MTDMTIRWRTSFGKKDLDARKAYEELEKIREKNGELTSDAVVQQAADKKHYLHNQFEWNDKVAGHEYRKNQARHLVRSIEIVREEAPDRPTRAYQINRSAIEPTRNHYKRIEDIMSNPDDRAELLKRALFELMACRRKFQTLQELAIVFRELDAVLEKIDL